MKKIVQFASFIMAMVFVSDVFAQTTIPIFNKVLYYDGYAARVDTPAPPAGVIRHRNDLYAVKMTEQQLAQIGSSLTMNVTIKASCDNYDRIGNVNLAFVPKGASTYNTDSVNRIEIARYITPFMNKNRRPDTVVYTYNVSNLTHLFKETSITTVYDIWVELQVFGVPYAANTQVSGCAGRNDVFFGSLDFVTSGMRAAESNNVLIPIDFQNNLNNYQAGASDGIGLTRRTINFTVEQPLTDAIFVLITSNHGANSGGEEYNRREHYVYFNSNEVLTYIPGRTTCEPFRVHNTQANGIYGSSPRTDEQWQSFSNWCPGDVIDTRIIQLGPVAAGTHSFMINVPDAQFVNDEGYFPISLYLQGKTSGNLSVSNVNKSYGLHVYPNPSDNVLYIETPGATRNIGKISLVNMLGQVVYTDVINNTKMQISTQNLPSGVYSLVYSYGDSQNVEKVMVTH